MSSLEKKMTYLIVDNNILPSISQPLKSNRIKYTCFEVSRNFLILGASSGGLYVFKRDPCVFLQLVPNKEGAVNNIALSWDEKLIAFSTLKGAACVIELQEGNEARHINRSLEHNGSVITSLLWAKNTNQLYVGDNIGRLSVINVSLFMNKSIFHVPAYMFMKLDSGVVQISCFEEYLLVSTKTRSYICDTNKEKYKQIGTQLREGSYGATFLNSTDGLKIYCARPGSRLWEVDVSGNVKSTHQFKKALATQSVAVVKLEENILLHELHPTWPDQSFNFCILVGLFDKYLFTFKSDGVYIFDPFTAEVVLWSDHYKDIVDAKCINDIVYLWTSLGKMHSFVITPLNKCLVQLYILGKYKLCVEVLERFLDHAKSFSIMSKVTCLIGLKDHLPSISKNSNLSSYIEKLLLSAKEKQLPNLDSGIFLVDNKHWKKWKLNVRKKTSRHEKIVRSRSLSDLNNLSIKPLNINKACINFAGSLPEMKLSVDNSNFQTVRNQSLYEPSLLWNVTLPASFMQQIPFLSLTSPDIIQSTIIELGQSVKNKLSIGTKSIQNKWHFIEEKFKISKELYNHDALNIGNIYLNGKNVNKKNIFDDVNLEENIVYQPCLSEVKQDNFIDVSELLFICDQISLNNKNEDSIYLLFDKVIEQMNLLNQLSCNDETLKKSFPFKQFVSVEYHRVIRDIFVHSFKHNYITKYLIKIKKNNIHLFDAQEHPTILKQIHTPEQLANDIALSNLILLFSEIIDPNNILNCLENLRLPCTFFSWSIVLDIFQDNAFSFFAAKKDSPLNYFDCPLPYLLNIIFLMFRLEQIESSCHMAMSAHLKLYHISYLIIKLSIHLEFTGIKQLNCLDKCNKLFLNSITCFLKNNLSLIKELYNPETLYHIEFAYFTVNKSLILKCCCNYPLLGNSEILPRYPEIGQLLLAVYLTPFISIDNHSLEPQKFESTFKFIILAPENVLVQNNLNKHLIEIHDQKFEFCVDFLYPNRTSQPESNLRIVYSKIIMLIQTEPNLFSMIINHFKSYFTLSYLPFIVQFGKIDDIYYISCKKSLKVWKEIFDLNLKLSNGECCICHYISNRTLKVDWNKISVLALKCLGSSEAWKLLMLNAESIPPAEIDISFYRIFFLKRLLEENNEKNLSLIDVYYEKLNPSNMNYISKELSTTPLLEVKENENAESSCFIKINVNHDLCCQCSLTLSSNNITKEGKIRAFRCKHIFHIFCLNLAKSLFDCPICVNRKKH